MKPNINVTPLIDVLLVLLIIFMVILPLKPAQFEARIPSEPENTDPIKEPDPLTLVVRINSDSTLALNNIEDLGTIKAPQKLSDQLKKIFAKRTENGVLRENFEQDNGTGFTDKIQKTVFIKAPKTTNYGEVVRAIDEIKLVGANPISLQIDDLE